MTAVVPGRPTSARPGRPIPRGPAPRRHVPGRPVPRGPASRRLVPDRPVPCRLASRQLVLGQPIPRDPASRQLVLPASPSHADPPSRQLVLGRAHPTRSRRRGARPIRSRPSPACARQGRIPVIRRVPAHALRAAVGGRLRPSRRCGGRQVAARRGSSHHSSGRPPRDRPRPRRRGDPIRRAGTSARASWPGRLRVDHVREPDPASPAAAPRQPRFAPAPLAAPPAGSPGRDRRLSWPRARR